MGIRFEYGSRKATNGPMIFFSDPVSEINLQDEIRGAIESRLCFYAYRMPGDMMVSFGSSEGVVEGIGKPGFVIAPFLPEGMIYTIPYAPSHRSTGEETYPFPEASTTREQYISEIKTIKRSIEGREDEKTVAARVKSLKGRVDVASTFLALTRAYPDAYTFCFSTPQTGCWIGATPELLLRKHGDTFSTMALAGTRRAFSPGEWDRKNMMEQSMVTDFIVSNLRDASLDVKVGETVVKRAGNIEHLCTPIDASTGHVAVTPTFVCNLLKKLSPTPATAGLPRDKALEIITANEDFQRAFYGGFCGPWRSENEFTLFVNLRCGRIERERYALYAGGGITAYSDPDKEWIETDMKLETLGKLLNIE